MPQGAQVAQSVKYQTLDFSSGQDLTVCQIEPRLGLCADSAEPAEFSCSLSASPLFTLSLSK